MPKSAAATRHNVLALAAFLALSPRLAPAATPTTYIGPDQGLWSNPLNWDNGLPSSNFPDALINSLSVLTVQMDANESARTLTLSAPVSLAIQDAKTLTLGSLANSGSVLLNGLRPTLSIYVNSTFSGGGTLLMSGVGNQITSDSTVRLTTDNIISGSGNIGLGRLKISNSGTITATAYTLTLQPQTTTDGFTNTGTLAANGGNLLLTAGTYSNTGGIIEAQANSIVSAPSAVTISGGILRSLPGGTVTLGNLDKTYLANVGLAGWVQSGTNSSNSLILMGTLTNSGTLAIRSGNLNFGVTFPAVPPVSLTNSGVIQMGQADSSATISVIVDTTLSGGGTVVLNGSNFSSPSNGSYKPRLTTDNVILGHGTFGATNLLSNSGTITATGGALSLWCGSYPYLYNYNTGVLRADGGTLNCGASLTNTGGTIEALADSVVAVTQQTTISGGTIRSSGNGTVTLSNAHLFNIAMEGIFQVDILPTSMEGTLTNSGSISFTAAPGSVGGLTFGPPLVQNAMSIVNPGVIQIGPNIGIHVNADTFLTGGGSLSFQGAFFNPLSLFRLTTDNYVSASGTIGSAWCRLTNTGTIMAANGTLLLQNYSAEAMANSGTLSAAPGGTLNLSSAGGVNNAGGSIIASPNAVVNINAPVTGGTFLANGIMNLNANVSAGNLSGTGTGTVATGTGSTFSAALIHIDTNKLTFASTTASRQSPSVLLNINTLTLSTSTTLDVTNHDLMIGNSNLTTIENEILKGFNKAGGPTDPAITSSTALSTANTFLVPIDADALLGNGTPGSAIGKVFDGIAISQPNTILLKYTYIGDITLDGKIDALDMATAAGHYNQSTPGLTDIQTAWLMGDINFDGTVDNLDFSIMNANSTLSSLAPLGVLDLTPVPEPSSLLLVLTAGTTLLFRAPKNRKSKLKNRKSP